MQITVCLVLKAQEIKTSSTYTTTGNSSTGSVELYYFATDDDYVDTT